jgi:Tfp pilus assembly protein PilO
MANSATEAINQITSKLSKMERKYWNIVLAVFLLLIMLVDYMLLMRPQIGTLSKLNPEIKVLSDNLKRTKNDIERITQYKDQVQALKKSVEELKTRVRSKQETSFIIEKISRIAHKHNVKIDQIMPNFLKQEVTLASEDRTYYDLPIMIEARSGYHDFGRFINEVEKEETFLEVRGLTVAAMAGTQLNAVKLTLNTIVYEEN